MLGEPIIGGRMLVAETGVVTAEFLGSNAYYFSTLYLDGPEQTYLFDKASPTDAAPIVLGSFEAGTELLFRLDVRNTGLSFYTGDAPRNPDGLAHAMATTIIDDSGVYVTTVGFEDLWGGGDLDFNDFMFRLNNVIDPLAVPAPPIVLLFALGLALLAVRHNRGSRSV